MKKRMARCGQCGFRFGDGVCGPTHALLRRELEQRKKKLKRALGPSPARLIAAARKWRTNDLAPDGDYEGFYKAELDLKVSIDAYVRALSRGKGKK